MWKSKNNLVRLFPVLTWAKVESYEHILLPSPQCFFFGGGGRILSQDWQHNRTTNSSGVSFKLALSAILNISKVIQYVY